MAPEQPLDGRLTIAEAAERLGCAQTTVRRAIHRGQLAAEKVAGDHGLTWRIPPDALQDYLRSDPTLNPLHKVMSLVDSSRLDDLMQLVHRVVQGMHILSRVNERQAAELARIGDSTPEVYKLILELAEARAVIRDRDRDLSAARALIADLQLKLAAERSRPWWRRLRRR